MKKYVCVSFLIILLLISGGIACSPAPTGGDTPGVPGKTQLRVAHSWPARIDPAVGGDFIALTLHPNIYDTLVFPTVEGTVIPWLAESWDVSDDGRGYTFHLRKGVLFHDGTELKASDVVYSMNRYLTIGQGMAYLFTNRIQNITALDDYTVEMTINEPYALFLVSLVRFSILNADLVKANTKPEGPYGEHGDYGTGWLLTNSAGSGPYTVKDMALQEFVLLEKNNEWWAKDKFVENSPDEVYFMPPPHAATLRTLMANRELDISDQWQSADTFKAVEAMDGIKIAAFDAVTVLHIYMNTSQPPLDCVHFRRAVSYAFDYDTAGKIDWPGTPQSKGPVPMNVAGHNPNIVPYRQDFAKAREELSKSKYADQLKNYPIQFHWVTEVPDEEKYALLLQANLKELGISVEITGTPWLTITEIVTTPESTPHMFPVYLNADLPDAGAMLFQRYHSRTTGTFFQGEWLLDKQFDAKIEAALEVLDNQARYAVYHELQEYINDLAPTLFVFDQLQKHAYQTYLDWPVTKGVVYPFMGYNQYFAFMGLSAKK